MPIEKIILRNFQKHERRSIELHPRATSLTGPSDAGKTTFLRAFRWLLIKDFPTKSALRDGADSVSAAVIVDGRKVKRSAGAGGNYYELDGKRFAAMGQDVPDEVAALLAIGEENFADQHAAHFWFSLTAGQASKELNRIVDLDVVDAALTDIANRSRRAKIEVELVQSRLAAARARRDDLDWVEDAVARLDQIEKTYNDVIQMDQMIAEIDSLVSVAENAALVVDRVLGASQAAEEVVKAGTGLLDLLARLDSLTGLVEAARKHAHRLQTPVPDLTALEAAKDGWEHAQEQVRVLAEVIDRAEAAAADLEPLERMAASMEKRMADAIKSAVICPTCRRPLQGKS